MFLSTLIAHLYFCIWTSMQRACLKINIKETICLIIYTGKTDWKCILEVFIIWRRSWRFVFRTGTRRRVNALVSIWGGMRRGAQGKRTLERERRSALRTPCSRAARSLCIHLRAHTGAQARAARYPRVRLMAFVGALARARGGAWDYGHTCALQASTRSR